MSSERCKARHREAQLACYREHGDYRYNPGLRVHRLRWLLPATLRQCVGLLKDGKP